MRSYACFICELSDIRFNKSHSSLLQLQYFQIGFDAEMRSAIVKVWSESGWTVSDRLRNISFSGRPNVRDIEWALRMNVARWTFRLLSGL